MKRKSPQAIYRSKLISDLSRLQMNMECIYSRFENAIDPDLVDSCIYELNAVQKRYKYVLKLIKDLDYSNNSHAC